MSFLSVYRAYFSLFASFLIILNKRDDSIKKDDYYYVNSIIYSFFILKKNVNMFRIIFGGNFMIFYKDSHSKDAEIS